MEKIYNNTDTIISQSLIKSFSKHTWYLTDELVPLCLFSDQVTHTDKQIIVNKLKSLEKVQTFINRYGSGFGKPMFPEVKKNSLNLVEFVGPSSWHFFTLLKIDYRFLDTPVDEWQSSPLYETACKIVKNIRTVNDLAERGVKLASDFLSVSKTEKHYQNALQVVENERSRVPNQRKARKTSKSWYLQY